MMTYNDNNTYYTCKINHKYPYLMIIEIAITRDLLYISLPNIHGMLQHVPSITSGLLLWISPVGSTQTHRVVLRQTTNTPQFDAWNSKHLPQPTILALTYWGFLQWFMIHTACTTYMTTCIVESDIIAPVFSHGEQSALLNTSSSPIMNCILWTMQKQKGDHDHPQEFTGLKWRLSMTVVILHQNVEQTVQIRTC